MRLLKAGLFVVSSIFSFAGPLLAKERQYVFILQENAPLFSDRSLHQKERQAHLFEKFEITSNLGNPVELRRGRKKYWMDRSHINLPPASWTRRSEAGIDLWLPSADRFTFSIDGTDEDCHINAEIGCRTMHYTGQKFIVEINEHDKRLVKKLKRPLDYYRDSTMDVNLQINGLQVRFVEMTGLLDGGAGSSVGFFDPVRNYYLSIVVWCNGPLCQPSEEQEFRLQARRILLSSVWFMQYKGRAAYK